MRFSNQPLHEALPFTQAEVEEPILNLHTKYQLHSAKMQQINQDHRIIQ